MCIFCLAPKLSLRFVRMIVLPKQWFTEIHRCPASHGVNRTQFILFWLTGWRWRVNPFSEFLEQDQLDQVCYLFFIYQWVKFDHILFYLLSLCLRVWLVCTFPCLQCSFQVLVSRLCWLHKIRWRRLLLSSVRTFKKNTVFRSGCFFDPSFSCLSFTIQCVS